MAEQNLTGPAGAVTGSESFTYHSLVAPAADDGRRRHGSVKIINPLTFPIASNISASQVVIHPGAMREIHWHTTSGEYLGLLHPGLRADNRGSSH
ncbi:hypothetical protein N0V85_009127 [Neurospora sp. IMI 360204]|nr:hypothetical protein N0V85_009127 [Neurospora sp. IMI 360204]